MSEARDGTVGEVIDGRRGVYGDPTEMFARAAQIWSGITGHHINAVDVPLMLIGYKTLRAQHTPDYSDNSDDIEGYLDIFRELVGDDMVHARSVSDYLSQKAGRQFVKDCNAELVVDQYVHGLAGADTQTCTWKPDLGRWAFEKNGTWWVCPLDHP